jgi:3-dehydroquinate dehydratase/shikimate dehydrogenase
MGALLCVPIMVHDEAAALADAEAARDAGADLVEFRIDEVFSGSGDENETKLVLRLVAGSPLPCIVTCRSAAEGGGYDGDDMERVSVYERLGTAGRGGGPTLRAGSEPSTPRSIDAPGSENAARIVGVPGEHPPRYLDCELETYTRSANLKQKVNLAVASPDRPRESATSLILSIHDFQGRPADLTRRLLRARSEPVAAVIKLAYRARSVRDNLELFDLLAERDRPMIALGMGEFGLASRVLASKFGGFLTFASLRSAAVTAPGQPTVREILETYRFRSVRASTKVFGIVGWPVGHSLSPVVHNAGFDETGFDGVYVPWPVQADAASPDASYASFKATVLELVHHPRLDLAGLSVTIPHKENLVRLARESGWEMDAASEATGAGNTLVVERGAEVRARVANTDAPALAACLAAAVGGLEGRRIAVLGAGGVARAAAYGLSGAGAQVVILNRTRARAERLVADIARAGGGSAGDVRVGEMGELETVAFDAVVNGTPVGMESGPEPERSPIDAGMLAQIQPGAVFMDTVYRPLRTPFLRQAEEAGIRTIDGVGMFVSQAEAQFRMWTGLEPPPRLFENRTRAALMPEQ